MSNRFGKYRGKVENNVDPMGLGRIQVSVPAVLGEGRLSWAMPCTPYAGPGVGFFVVPPVGANVWVEFEGGDTDYPIWSGCFWGTGEVPATPASPEMKVLKTDGTTLTLNDTASAGGLTLEVASPAVSASVKIVIDSSGLQITAEPATVRVTPSEIEMSLEAVNAKLSSSDLALTNGGASVKLSSSSVSVNDGALEVT